MNNHLRNHVLASLTGVFFLLATALAEPKAQVSIDQCIAYGLRNNLSLTRSNLEQMIDKPAIMAAWGRFLPTVSVGYSIDQSRFYNQTYLNPDGSVVTLPVVVNDSVIVPVQEGKRRSSDYFVRLNEMFFDGGRNYRNLLNSSLANELRAKNLSADEMNLRNTITRAFCLALAARQRVELSVETLEQRRRQLDFAQARYNAGSVTKRDVMLAEVEVGRAVSDSVITANELQNSMERLNFEVGFPIDSTYDLHDMPALKAPDRDVAELTETALSSRNELKAAMLTTRIKRNDLLAAKGDYLPSLSGNIVHTRTEQSGVNRSYTLAPRNRYTSLGLTLSWELFDQFTRSLRRQQTTLDAQQSQIDRLDLERRIRQEVSAAVNSMSSAYQQSLVAAKNVDLALETLRFEEERYRLGSSTSLDLGTAQVSYIQARSDMIRIETEYHIALAELERATGTIIRRQG